MPAGRPRSDQQLSHCREEGLQCKECVERVATSVTRICSEMTPSNARQVFLQVYTEPACAQMSGAFVQAVVRQQVPKRMPGRELRVVAGAAVAVA